MTTSKLAITNIDSGNQSAIRDNTATSLRDVHAWRLFWQHHKSDDLPTPPLPTVDFDKEIVIIYMLGEKSRGSTRVFIESVEDDGASLTVTVACKMSSGLSTSAMCNPYAIAKVQADKTRRVHINLRAPRVDDIET